MFVNKCLRYWPSAVFTATNSGQYSQYGPRARLVSGYYFIQQPRHEVTVRIYIFFRQNVITVSEQVKLMAKFLILFWRKGSYRKRTLHYTLFALEIREDLRTNIVALQADIHFLFLRQQLLSDLYSTLDGKQVHRKFLLQQIITTPFYQDIFWHSPSCRKIYHLWLTRFHYLSILFS